MYRLSLFSLVTVSALFTGATAVGQDSSSADEITVIGLRPVSAGEVTSAYSVLTETDLAVRSAPYIADQLRAVPGIGLSRSGAVGGLTQIRLRGAEGNHTLVLVDGIDVSDPTTGETDFGLWSAHGISRIEVARGEQSALYGSDAIGGVIALFTDTEGFSAAAEGGSRQTARGQLGYTHKTERAYGGFSISGQTTEGIDTSDTTGEEDGSDATGLLLRAGTAVGDDWSVKALARISQSHVQTDQDTDFDGRLDDTLHATQSQQHLIGISAQGPGAGFDHQLRASLNRVERENTLDDVFNSQTEGQRIALSYSPSRSWETAHASHQISALLDYDDLRYERIDTAVAFGDPNQTQSYSVFGLAGEYRTQIQRLSLSAAARHDQNDELFDDATTWRIGAAYQTGIAGRIRASVGTGVKNPTFTELFGFAPQNFVGNPDLKPETSTSFELGWDQTFAQGTVSVTYFHAALEDEIRTVFSQFPFTAENLAGDSERSGVEFSTRWTPNDRWTVDMMATHTQTTDKTSGQDEIRVPDLTGSVSAMWTPALIEGLTVRGAVDYVGSQQDTDFSTFERVTLDAYALASLTASIPLHEGVALTVRGENLFDTDIVDVVGYKMPGAGLFVGVKWE